LVVPLKTFLADEKKTDAGGKVWAYEALQALREQAVRDLLAGSQSSFRAESALPAAFRVVGSLDARQNFPVELATRAPMISFADARDQGPGLHASLQGRIRNLPPSVASARVVAIGLKALQLPSEASVFRVQLGGIGTFSFFFGRGSSRELGKSRFHRLDPRLFRGKGEIPVTCRLERLSSGKPAMRSLLMLQGITLVVKN
jgi:hypothetical protein